MQRCGMESIKDTNVSCCMFFLDLMTAEVRDDIESYCFPIRYTSMDNIAHMFSIGFKSGERAGQSITFTPCSAKKSVDIEEVWMAAVSC